MEYSLPVELRIFLAYSRQILLSTVNLTAINSNAKLVLLAVTGENNAFPGKILNNERWSKFPSKR